MMQEIAPQNLIPLFEYFNALWMTRVPLIRWNVHDVDMRTNNFVEGWNSRFNVRVQRHHANLWYFLDCLKDEQAATELAEQQFGAGQNIAGPRNDIYRQIGIRIEALRVRYADGAINAAAYVQGIAYLISQRI